MIEHQNLIRKKSQWYKREGRFYNAVRRKGRAQKYFFL